MSAGRFLATSAAFLAGLLGVLKGVDRALRHQQPGVGTVVATAVSRATLPRLATRSIFLGDSVAAQLFPPGTEPEKSVRFLTTNQAVSVAGQYYLAEEAVANSPNLKDVYLFYLPGAWANDLPPALTHDYFCGYFHEPRQVAEVFAVKHDFALSAAHAGRWLLPNLMAANSDSRPAFALQPDVGRPAAHQASPDGPSVATPGTAPPPPDPEPVLTMLSDAFAPAPEAAPPQATPPTPPGTAPILFSPVSRHYLAKLRDLCRSHGVALHVLPCPCSTATRFDESHGPYDAPIVYVDPGLLVDAVHFAPRHVNAGRRLVREKYPLGLDPKQFAGD